MCRDRHLFGKELTNVRRAHGLQGELRIGRDHGSHEWALGAHDLDAEGARRALRCKHFRGLGQGVTLA